MELLSLQYEAFLVVTWRMLLMLIREIFDCALKRPVSQSFLYSLPDRLPSQRLAWNKSISCGVKSLTSHYNQNVFHNDKLKLKTCKFYFTAVMTLSYITQHYELLSKYIQN